jgi:hypothetical protein
MSKIHMPRYGRNFYGCECMARTLPLIEADMIRGGDLKAVLDFAQGAYNVGVTASAQTHWGGGVADTAQCNWAKFGHYWKKWGVIDFERFAPLFPHHGHLVWVGCPHQNVQCDAQERGAVKSGWNGLSGRASRYGEWFRVPAVSWQEAVKKYTPPPKPPAPPKPPPPKGILGMTKPIYYHWGPPGGTALPDGGVVWPILDKDGHISLEDGAGLVSYTATVGISGLGAGERVDAAFQLVDDFPGTKPTLALGMRRPKALTAGNNVRTIHFTGRIPKSKNAGGTTKLRVNLTAHAKAAKLAWVQIDGLVSE